MVPYAPGITLSDFNLGILYMLAMSSLSTYGILLAGWSANSKYAFLGSLRSTAQLISYELILSSAILLVILFSGSLSLIVNVESQRVIWYVFPLLPIFIIFYIGSVAETNRAPFDLVEAESELVSGFMTEHSAVVFVFFFLAEYASILLICILTGLLFLGGYIVNTTLLYDIISYIIYPFLYLLESTETITKGLVDYLVYFKSIYIHLLKGETCEKFYLIDRLYYGISWYEEITYKNFSEKILYLKIILYHKDPEYYFSYFIDKYFSGNPLLEGLKNSVTLGLKSSVMIFIFIWVRASYPRIRYDQLMSFCWTILLPIIIAFIILFPCVLYNFDVLPISVNLF